jgi:hypothetical protein
MNLSLCAHSLMMIAMRSRLRPLCPVQHPLFYLHLLLQLHLLPPAYLHLLPPALDILHGHALSQNEGRPTIGV